MALQITKLLRTVPGPFTNVLRTYAVLAKSVHATPSAVEVTDFHLVRRIDDASIWTRGISKEEVLQFGIPARTQNDLASAGLTTSDKVLCEGKVNATTNSSGDPTGRPSASQLQVVHASLADHLPKLFVMSLNYKIFHPNLIFENNISGKRTVGLLHFARQVAFLRIVGHWKFAYVKLDVLKMTNHTEDGTIRVRWRIRGIPMWKVVMSLWKYKLWNIKEALKDLDGWYDGYSTFYVGADGLIYKHVVDKMMPDQDSAVDEPKRPLVPKVVLALGLFPRDLIPLTELGLCTSTQLLP